MSFHSLGLSDALLKAISKKGYTTPSPIQEKTIPHILQGKDVLASAQTGTGKTAGFTLPMLELMKQRHTGGKRTIKSLILTPTRELAAQVQESVMDYGEFLPFSSLVIYGGVNANPQIAALKRGVDILVATPGRLLDLHSQGFVNLREVEFLVLDEADRMLDMGFIHDIKRVLRLLPQERQNLLFSATFSRDILGLAEGLLHHPVRVEATPENSTAERIEQDFIRVDQKVKHMLLIRMIEEGNWSQVLVFTRTKHGANKLAEKLVKAGITAAAIHGNKSQTARLKALGGFKKNDVRVLVATDIAARGLDIPLLPHVVNFELPNIAEDYVHRIGRTGRAGAEGEALSLVSADELEYVRGIEKLLGTRFTMRELPGFIPQEREEVKPERSFGRPQRPGAGTAKFKGPRPAGQGGSNPNRNRPSRRPGRGGASRHGA